MEENSGQSKWRDQEKQYKVVNYIEENQVAVVPSCWVVGDTAVWPPFKSNHRIIQAVKNKQSPENNWATYAIKILYETDDYQTAKKTKDAEDTSNLESAEEEDSHPQRKKKRPLRYESDDSDSPLTRGKKACLYPQCLDLQ